MIKFLFFLSMFSYQLGEGLTEGYTWAGDERRDQNVLICDRLGEGHRGVLDYHAWRLVESASIAGMVLTFDSQFLVPAIGGMMFGDTYIYNTALKYVHRGDPWYWKEGKTFHLLSYELPTSKWFSRGLGLVGLVLMIIQQ